MRKDRIEFDIRRDNESGQFRVSILYGGRDFTMASQQDFTIDEARALVNRIRYGALCAKLNVDLIDHRTDDSGNTQ